MAAWRAAVLRDWPLVALPTPAPMNGRTASEMNDECRSQREYFTFDYERCINLAGGSGRNRGELGVGRGGGREG